MENEYRPVKRLTICGADFTFGDEPFENEDFTHEVVETELDDDNRVEKNGIKAGLIYRETQTGMNYVYVPRTEQPDFDVEGKWAVITFADVIREPKHLSYRIIDSSSSHRSGRPFVKYKGKKRGM